MENSRLIQVSLIPTKAFGPNDILFEILNLGPLLVVHWNPGFLGWGLGGRGILPVL